METRVNYTDEPKDGLELPASGFKVLTRAEEKAWGLEPPAPGTEYERTEKDGVVRLAPKRGGARPGAGRKPTGHVRMHILVSKEARQKILRLAKKQKITISEAVDRMAKSA
ncbi:MAG TPA: hypothetical protein VIS74_02805 [Chthoniobacterales bacterium]